MLWFSICFEMELNYVTLIKWNDIFNKNMNNWWILDKTWWWCVTAEQVVDLYIGKKNLRVLLQDALSAKSLIGWIQKAQNRKCPYISTYYGIKILYHDRYPLDILKKILVVPEMNVQRGWNTWTLNCKFLDFVTYAKSSVTQSQKKYWADNFTNIISPWPAMC